MSKHAEHLTTAETSLTTGDNDTAIAAALTGLLSAVTEIARMESQEDYLRKQWDSCDEAIGRVRTLADELDAHPNATLKPTAFRDLAKRIHDAIDDVPA